MRLGVRLHRGSAEGFIAWGGHRALVIEEGEQANRGLLKEGEQLSVVGHRHLGPRHALGSIHAALRIEDT